MLKKRLGIEGIERNWLNEDEEVENYFKIPPKLTIPKGVKRIGVNAFAGCRNLREAVIPESVEYIGPCAFYKCSNATIILKKPMSEFKVGDCAFDGVILEKPKRTFKYWGFWEL